MQDINASSLPGSPEGSLIAKAQGCGLAATMGLRDHETRVYARARTEHAETVAFRRMPIHACDACSRRLSAASHHRVAEALPGGLSLTSPACHAPAGRHKKPGACRGHPMRRYAFVREHRRAQVQPGCRSQTN